MSDMVMGGRRRGSLLTHYTNYTFVVYVRGSRCRVSAVHDGINEISAQSSINRFEHLATQVPAPPCAKSAGAANENPGGSDELTSK